MRNQSNKNNKPTHFVSRKVGHGRHVEFETIGAAWEREDGGLYLKLYGTQIIEDNFYAIPNKEQKSQTENTY